jgi:peptidoglycan/LPS O-acetylase OafA/YrhL
LYFIAILVTIFLQYYLGSPFLVNNTQFVAAGNATSFSNFCLMQGIFSLNIMFNIPVWSIGVEVFFYLLIPKFFSIRLIYLHLIILISLLFYFGNSYLSTISLYGIQHLMYAWLFILGFLIVNRKQFWIIIPYNFIGAFGIYYNFLNETIFEKYSFLMFLVSVLFIYIFLFSKFSLSKSSIYIFNYLGIISYPIYLFHTPLYILLYYFGIKDPYLFLFLFILLCIPINYLFDYFLKNIFWNPLVNNIEKYIVNIKIKLSSIKTIKS